jgi:hypothetical protein
MQTKIELIKKHLTKKKNITSWEAIIQYKATRLSAIIHTLRKRGYDIATQNIQSKDANGNTCTFAKYVLVSLPQKS